MHHLKQFDPDVLVELGGKDLQEVIEEPDSNSVGLAPHEALGIDGGYLQISLAEVVGKTSGEFGHEVPPQVLHAKTVPGLLFGVILSQFIVGVGVLEVKDVDKLLLIPYKIDNGLVDKVDVLLLVLLVF